MGRGVGTCVGYHVSVVGSGVGRTETVGRSVGGSVGRGLGGRDGLAVGAGEGSREMEGTGVGLQVQKSAQQRTT